jgi:catalase
MQDPISILRTHGLQATPQRIAVATYVLRTQTHPPADEVWAQVRKSCPTISRGTVYNTLNLLVEKSLGGPVDKARFKEPPLRISGDADRYDHREGNDDHTQPGNLYRLLPDEEREHLHAAVAGAMRGVTKEIVERQLAHFEQADPAYAKGVRKALKRS